MDKRLIKTAWIDSDGYWIELIPGWQDAENPQCHTITEDTRREAMAHLVEPCNCRGCRDALATVAGHE